MTLDDLEAWGILGEKEYPCIMKVKETRNGTELFICEIQTASDSKFQKLKVNFISCRFQPTEPTFPVRKI